jgi:hypothetical protein
LGEYKRGKWKMKVKLKLPLCFNWAQRHEGILGSGGIAPRILDLGTRWRWVVNFTPSRFTPQGKNPPQYPSDRRLGGPQSWSGRGGEEKNSQPPPGIELPNPDRPARSQSLHRLSYPGSSSSYWFFLFTTASRTAVGPTQPHIQWVPRVLSLGVKRPEFELTAHLHLVPRWKYEWSYTSTPQYALLLLSSSSSSSLEFRLCYIDSRVSLVFPKYARAVIYHWIWKQ